MADIFAMKVWKKNASIADRFEELAHYARQHPEKFESMVCGWTWQKDNGKQRITDWVSAGCPTSMDVAGVLAMMQMELHEHIHQRGRQ